MVFRLVREHEGFCVLSSLVSISLSGRLTGIWRRCSVFLLSLIHPFTCRLTVAVQIYLRRRIPHRRRFRCCRAITPNVAFPCRPSSPQPLIIVISLIVTPPYCPHRIPCRHPTPCRAALDSPAPFFAPLVAQCICYQDGRNGGPASRP